MPIRFAASQSLWEDCALAFASAISRLPRSDRLRVVRGIASASLDEIARARHPDSPAALDALRRSLSRVSKVANEVPDEADIVAFSSGLEELEAARTAFAPKVGAGTNFDQTMHLVSAATSFIFAAQVAAWMSESPEDYARWQQDESGVRGVYDSPKAQAVGRTLWEFADTSIKGFRPYVGASDDDVYRVNPIHDTALAWLERGMM